eukprot:CAMPEP_0204317266 /NCGR_PEP_ID=MMETSP0469-20131031/5872_1 /ASSEMBLY_ACC=CAM_ASM_000384 /TAXON_ID=2969 /ORGANISM="Oxyrrhis marina" /LENGTH=99 /DNA_ID=CAMNT_0051298163 /DNA_START=76 /DNA_END=375 /DNA_ORIENTATION=+
MFCERRTFLEIRDAQESVGKRRTQSVDRWMQSGHEEWADFKPDLRSELLAAGKKRAECCSADAHSPPSGTAYLCTHKKKGMYWAPRGQVWEGGVLCGPP